MAPVSLILSRVGRISWATVGPASPSRIAKARSARVTAAGLTLPRFALPRARSDNEPPRETAIAALVRQRGCMRMAPSSPIVSPARAAVCLAHAPLDDVPVARAPSSGRAIKIARCPALTQGEAALPEAPGRPPQGGVVASMFPIRLLAPWLISRVSERCGGSHRPPWRPRAFAALPCEVPDALSEAEG